MASRTSASIGVGITITVLGILCLGLFISTIIFLSKFQNASRSLEQAHADQADFVSAEDRNADTMQSLKDAAKKDKKSVVGYLNASLRTVGTRVSGSPSATPDALVKRIDELAPNGGSLADLVGSQQNDIKNLNDRLTKADDDRKAALENLTAEGNRVKALVDSQKKTIDALNADIGRYRAELDIYRKGVGDAKSNYDAAIEKDRSDATVREAGLNDRIKKLESENLQLIDRLRLLQADKSKDILKPQSEAALVDGSVISLDGSSNTVTIDRGRKDKVFLGMSFAVYSDATQIKPDPKTGDYPKGKATVEIIRVDETSSLCRVTSDVKGNPIVRGDVIANALYDPKKVYTFLVYGNFDTNGDGRATAAEAGEVKALIEGWGGKTTEELGGDVDFVVLGQKPQVPPRPSSGAPIAVLQEYIRLDTAAQNYDKLFQQAAATSIPVLNENRLYTLIGRR